MPGDARRQSANPTQSCLDTINLDIHESASLQEQEQVLVF